MCASKRMISLQIVDTDAFLDMPLSTQALYFHLLLRADDEGFINNPKKILRLIGCQDDDMKILLGKRFILSFENGIVVIKHWLIHNTIRMDRFNKTVYTEEKKLLFTKENKAYTLDKNKLATKWQPLGNHLATQVKLSKVKLSKVSKTIPPTFKEVQGYCKERKNDVDAQRFIDFYESKGWVIGKAKMKSWKACVRTWESKDNNSSNIRVL